jgi:PleD family two-component response regulator
VHLAVFASELWATFLLRAIRVQRKPAKMSQLRTNEEHVVRIPAKAAVHSTGHVLVADGNAASRQRRRSQLEAAGFRVSVARTGFEAIVKASCHVPDLILIDESLEDIEAEETGRLITTCPVTAHIPIVRIPRGRRVPARVFARMRATG